MPQVVAIVAVAVTAAAAAYSAYAQDAAGNDRRNAEQKQFDLNKAALEQQGVRTAAELKLANLQIDKAALDVFDKQQTQTAASTASAAPAVNPDFLTMAAVALVGYVGWRTIKR